MSGQTGRQNRTSLAAAIFGAAFAAVFAAGPIFARPAGCPMDAALKAELSSRTRSAPTGLATPLPMIERVIVQTRGKPTLAMERSFHSLGGQITQRFHIIDGFAGSIPTSNIPRLAAQAGIARLSSDLQLKKRDVAANAAIGADIVASSFGLDGTGVTVAVLDSGIMPSKDFSSATDPSATARLIYGPNDSDEAPDKDKCGHGTHVAGIIGGNGANSTGPQFIHTYQGVAPGVTLLSVKILDEQGQGRVSCALAAIEWCIQNKAADGIQVMNLSFGHPVVESYKTDPLCQAVEAAWKAGIVVVCAAGNGGRSVSDDPSSAPAFGWIDSPGNDPYVITVGATDDMGTPDRSDDVMATYSSHGPTRIDHILKPDLVAPGNRIISVAASKSYLYKNYLNTNGLSWKKYVKRQEPGFSPTYFQLSGTSMAAAMVSGAAALLLQQDPTLNPDTIKGRLMKTARKQWNPSVSYTPFYRGAGLLDIPAALGNTDSVQDYALSPVVTRTNDGSLMLAGLPGSYSVIWDDSVIWSDRVIWGDSVVWSDSVIWSDSVVWDDTVIWSDSIVQAASKVAADISRTAIQGE